MSHSYLDLFHANARAMDTSAIREVFQLAAQLKDPINLSIGQPDFGVPEPIKEAAIKAIRDGHTAYTLTQGIPELREAYAEKVKAKNGIDIQPDQVLITSGVSSCLQLIFSSMIEPGQKALVIEPYFLMYRSCLEFYGVELTYLNEHFTADDIAALPPAEEFQFIIFSNPSNPTGKVLGKEQQKLLAGYAAKGDTLVIADEIYEEFDYDGEFISFGSHYPHTLSLFGFSKTYSMTGMRLSALVGPLEIVQKLTTIQQYTVVCAPSVSQHAGLAALKTDMSEYVKAYRKKRDFVAGSLSRPELADKLEYVKPGGAFYFFLYLKSGEAGMDFVKRAIAEKELLMVPGHIFTRKQNAFRISYATSDDKLAAGMEALTKILP